MLVLTNPDLRIVNSRELLTLSPMSFFSLGDTSVVIKMAIKFSFSQCVSDPVVTWQKGHGSRSRKSPRMRHLCCLRCRRKGTKKSERQLRRMPVGAYPSPFVSNNY